MQIGVFLSNKHYDLSVNECILVSALYRWYKSGKKEIMDEERLNAIINTILLASKKDPSIVSDDHIHPDHGIFRVYVYWDMLRDMAQRSDFIDRLIPLNPQAMRLIYDYKI